MGIVNREGALYIATGMDNTGLYAGRREAMGIIKAMASQITSFDVFGGLGISAGVAFASAAKDAYNFEKEFRKNMLEVATISAQIGGSLTENMNKVVEITQQIPISAPEAAKALYQIVSAGHDGAAGMEILKVSAKSAVGGLTDTATAADAITTILNAYKLSANKAAQVSDQLFTTVRLGKTDFSQLGSYIAQVAPIAASYGVEIDQVLAAVASLTKSGTPTAQAMTQIRAAIIGTSKVLGDGAFDSRTFQEALAEVAAQANGSESKLRELVPEIEAVNGVLGMTGKNAQTAASDLNELQNSTGATEAAFQKMQEDVDNQLKLLSNNIHAALRPMGEAILKEVSSVAQAFNKAFADGRVEAAMEHLGDLIVLVTGALVGYKSSLVAVISAKTLYHAVTNWIIKAKTQEAVKIVLSGKAYAAEAAIIAKNTGMHVLLTNALKAQTAALAKNATMLLSSPYTWAAVAIAGVGYALYKYATQASAAELAQRRFNDAVDKFNQKAEARRQKIEQLLRVIQDETETEYAKLKAYEELSTLSPMLTAAYDLEKLKVLELKDANKKLNEERDKANYDNILSNINHVTQQIEKLNKKKGLGANSGFLIQKGFESEMKVLQNDLDLWKKALEDYNKSIEQAKQKEWEANTPLEEKVKYYEKLKESLEEQRRALYQQIEPSTVLKTSVEDANKAWAQMPDIIGQIKLDTLNKKIDETSKKINSLTGKGDGSMLAVSKNKSHWEEQKKNAITALEAIDSKAKSLLDAGNKKGAKTFLIGDLKKTEKEADAIVKTYQDSVKKLNEANKNLKLYDFSEKKTDVLKSQQDLSRSILDADLKFQSERIAIMEDGRKKRLAQSEIEHKQQKAAIEKEYQDTIQKYKDLKQAVPETVETTYKARLQANDEAKTIRDKRINEEMDKALMERQKEITSVFLSEEEKRLNAIRERYDKEREWAKKSFQSGSFSSKDDYEAYLTTINDAEAEERKKSLLDKHQDYTDRRLAIEKKFNDDIATLQAERRNVEVKGQTYMVQQIDRAIAQATRDKAQSLVSLDFEQLKKRPEYVRAFENLKQTSSETLGSLLTQLENAKQTAAEVLSPDQLREYTSTIESIMDELAERNPFQALAERKKELAEAEEELANAKRNLDYVNGGGKIVTGMNYDKNTGKTEQSYLSSTQALENYNKAKDKAVKANARVIDAEKKASNVIRKLGDSLQDVGDSMGGLGGEIISIIGSITSTVMAGIEGMQNASEIGAAAIRTIEKASVILAIISAALQIANKIASLFKQTDYMAEFRKEMEELNYELELTRLNAEISTDENSIFGDDLWGNAIKNVLLANEVFMKYNDTLKEISDRKKYTGLMGIITENKGLKNSYDSLADSLANMQIQIRHSTWFRSAKYSSLKDAAPELFNADGTVNMNALKGFLGTDTFKKLSEENQKYLQEMSDYWETYQEAVDQVKGYLTNIFGELGNTMSDALVDAFENGTDAAQAFTDSVVDMLETLAKQMIYSITLTPVIENAQKKMLDVTKNEKLNEEQKFNNYISILDELTDGVLSEQERYNKFLEKYQEMAAQKGFDIFTPDEEETERTATAKSGIAASQDSVNELNGNFNAMLIYSEKTCEEVAQVREHLAYIGEAQKEGWQNVKVIRELTEKVEEHTSKIVELTEKIEKNTGDTAGGIEEMNIKGVYLKK